MATYALAKKFTNEQIIQKATNAPTRTLSFDNGILPLPTDVVNGQVSVIQIQGNTRTNLFNKDDSNFELYNATKENTGTGIKLTSASNGTYRRVQITLNLTPSEKYTIKRTLKIISGCEKANDARLNVIDSSNRTIIGFSKNETGSASRTFTVPSDGIVEFVFYVTFNEASEGIVEYNDIVLEKGEEAKSYISYGTKSTNSVRLVSVGKNLFDKLVIPDNTELEYQKIDNSTFTIKGLGISGISNNLFPEKFLSGTQYTFSGVVKQDIDNKNTRLRVNYTDGSFDELFSPALAESGFEFVSDAGKTIEKITYSYSSPGGTTTVKNFQIEEGTTATEYEPHKQAIVYINTNGELRSLPNGTNDEVNVTQGVKTQRNGEYNDVHTQTNWTMTLSGMPEEYVRFNKVLPISNALSVTTSFLSNISLGINQLNFKVRTIDSFSSASEESCGLRDGNNLYILIRKDRLATVDSSGFEAWLQSQGSSSLIYQLVKPIVTQIPKQKLEVFEGGTVYVELLSEPGESTYPLVELEVPIGDGNQLGVAEHDFKAAAADWVLTSNEGKCGLLKPANAGDAVNIVAPAKPRCYLVENLTGQNVTVKTATSAGVTIAADTIKAVAFNGEDYKEVL